MSHRPFQPFSTEHGVAILFGAMVVALLIVMGRSGGRWKTVAAMILTFANLTAHPFNQVSWLSLGGKVALDNLLPFHLCDIAAITAGFAMITRSHLLRSLTYFWGLAATVQALLTPALSVGFPSWPYFSFFVQHFAIVGAALYFPIVDGWRPKNPFWRSPLEVYACSVAYILIALTINTTLKTNFGFASRPPDNPSLIDHLGPWPWYLFSMQAIAVVVFLLLALPFMKKEVKTDDI